ncbi:MAG: hypothetical protein IJ719_08520 [Clostridia bacterium]|nr:hypothetical protein [Clostridia bacterium]
MKKMIALIVMAMLLAALLIPAMAEQTGYDLDAAKQMDKWVYIDSTEVMTPMGQIKEGETASVYPCYGLLNVVYCANPESARIQHLDIYVPTEYVKEAKDNGDGTYTLTFDEEAVFTNLNGATYTVNTAPIIYQNTIDGYKEGYSITLGTETKGIHLNADQTGNSIYGDYVKAGYIYVCVGSRGVDSEGLEETHGMAPDQIVDLKAGVRYLKANDAVLPGDAGKIIAVGGSAGGSCATLLGVSGNAEIFNPYLEKIGAIMDATDDIYGARVQAPIANVDKTDMAYEYLHSTETQYHQMGPDGGDRTFDDFQMALQKELIAAFEQYLGELGFDTATFKEGYLAAINEALDVYTTTWLDKEQYVDAEGFAGAYEGISLVDGKVVADSMEAFVASFMTRSKSIMGFDTEASRSWEAKLFGGAHFSASLLDVLKKMAGEGSEEAARLVDAYTQPDTGVYSEGKQDLVKMMACMTYLTGEEKADIARHWRFNNSTMDGDVGSMMAYLMSRYMQEQLGIADVDFYLGIDKISPAGHGYPDFCFLQVEAYLDAMVAAE